MLSDRCFGTIITIMPYRNFRLKYCLLAFFIITSCAPVPAPNSTTRSQVDPAVLASPTPFQPNTNGSQNNLPFAHLAPATFTPYPTVSSLNSILVVPKISTPSANVFLSPSVIDPLTGLTVSDPTLLNRRPLAIKISNYPREIRPQYGLNLADVVFEYYIEWFDTRFIAVFYGHDASQVGPVRSGRYFDEHITRMYHSYYVFNFADPREYTYYLGGDLEKFLVTPGCSSCTCPPFFVDRVSSQITDINHLETYFNTTTFSQCLTKKGADNSQQSLRNGFFNAKVPSNGFAVDRIYTHYSFCDYNYWEYNPGSGRYLRYQEISPNQKPEHIDDCIDKPETYAPLTDALTQQQVSTDNVVELFVSHTFANLNEQQDEIYHINLVDSGNAFVFRDGLGFPARWIRTDINQPLLITTLSGVPIYFKPGNTFYQVIGDTSTDWSDGSYWHFDFHTP
jgi:hypothetical protein